MAKFDLGAFAQTLRTVPESGTAERMQIEYIDIDLLDGSPDNFYELRGIDELAGDIETVGLQQPLLVSPGEGGHFTVLSGHRRRAALQTLVEAGRDDLRMVPCIRSAPGSPALDKLRLLYANAHTRVLTPAELAKQAALAEDTIYQLKAEGHEFPGRMRELVAEVCGIKSSKLGRLKKIDKHLAPCRRRALQPAEGCAGADQAGVPQEDSDRRRYPEDSHQAGRRARLFAWTPVYMPGRLFLYALR